MNFRKIVALILMLPLLTSVIVIRRGDVDPVYRLTFNDSAPYGTDEDSDGTADCTTHGATSTDTDRFDCECTAGCDAQEGDGVLKHDGGGGAPTETKWCEALDTGLTEFWVKWWYYVDETASNPRADIISFRNAAGCDLVGSGYYIQLTAPSSNSFKLWCDFTSTAAAGAYVDQTWSEYLVHVDIDSGLLELWKDDFTGAADWSCDGTGGDGATPFDGLAVRGDNDVDLLRWDDLRVYDADPR